MTTNHFTRRHAVVLSLGAAVVGGFGCATAIVASSPNSRTTIKKGAVVLTDDILAFGRPDAALAKSMGTKNAVAFLGKANTYLLVEGGDALLSMTKLDPARLTMETDNANTLMQDKTIWGTLDFNYASDVSTVTEEEKATFKALHFYRTSPTTVSRTVHISGAVYPAISLQGTAFTAMQKTRQLSFRAPPTSEEKPDLSKIVKLPGAIVVDIVTLPLQLLGGALLLIAMH